MGDLTFVMDGHLGGYVEGGDPNTTYPTLWNALIRDEMVQSVLDVGCGDGRGALSYFRDHGCAVQGIDGVPQPDIDVLQHDYTTGPVRGFDGIIHPNPDWDLVWSAEFVEHVDERHVPNFLRDFARAPLVMFTHAVPGQAGYHHVNCRTSDYWIGVMAAIGYQLDGQLTAVARELALDDVPEETNYFARTGMAFRRGGGT